MRVWWLGLLWSWACACAPPFAAFECTTDSQCVDGPHQGACEITGYCSFPDLECDSNRRYGPLAASDLAGMCVPIDEGTGASADTSSSGPDPITMTSTSATSGSSDSGESTLPVADSSSSSSADSDSSGMPPPGCAVYADDFEDGMLSAEWEEFSDIGCEVSESSGRLEIAIGPGDEWRTAGIAQERSDLRGRTFRALFAPIVAPIDNDVVIWLSVGDTDVCSLEVGIAGDRAAGYSYLDYIDGPAIDTTQAVWMQLRIDVDSVVHWEILVDSQWQEFHTEASPCELADEPHQLWAGADTAIDTVYLRAIEEFSSCDNM